MDQALRVAVATLALAACDAPPAQPVAEPPVTSATPAVASASAPTAASAAGVPTLPKQAQPIVRRSLDCSNYFGCTVTDERKIACWGFNQFGQLGKAKQAYPAKGRGIVPVPPAVSVAVGLTHACALTEAGEVWCWGESSGGATGDGVLDGEDAPVRVIAPKRVEGLGGKAVDVDADNTHTCAALDDGGVACWGDNLTGSFGAGRPSTATPVRIDGVTGAVEVATGESQTCSRSATGDVTCFGAAAPAVVPGICAKQIAVHTSAACAVACEGGVSCWGSLPGYNKNASVPTTQPLFGRATEIRAGFAHYIARDDEGRVLAWGSNDSGQIGSGKPKSWDTAFADDPVALSVPWKAAAVCAGGIASRGGDKPYLRPATFLDSGTSCARTDRGEVHCWGEPDLDYVPKLVTLPK